MGKKDCDKFKIDKVQSHFWEFCEGGEDLIYKRLVYVLNGTELKCLRFFKIYRALKQLPSTYQDISPENNTDQGQWHKG